MIRLILETTYLLEILFKGILMCIFISGLKNLPNLSVIDSNSFFISIIKRVRKSLVARFKRFIQRRCTAVVYIGGSIFIEYDNWKHILAWWNYEAENFPFYVLGANFGPYKNEAFKEAFYNVFAKMKDICFRDTYSYTLFKDCLTVRYASDILFMTDLPKTQLRKRQVFFSIISELFLNFSAKRKNPAGIPQDFYRFVNFLTAFSAHNKRSRRVFESSACRGAPAASAFYAPAARYGAPSSPPLPARRRYAPHFRGNHPR